MVSINSYTVYIVKCKLKSCSIDAMVEDGRMGRLINHSATQANIIPKIVEVKTGKVCLYFTALREIGCGEELVYDYGERSPVIVKANPWLCD